MESATKKPSINRRAILFSAIVTAVIGAIIGIGASEMSINRFSSKLYQNLHRKYAIAGAIFGFAIGAGQETLRQMKSIQDFQEAQYLQDRSSSDLAMLGEEPAGDRQM